MQYQGVCSLSIRFRKIYVTFSRFCFLRLEPPYTRSLRAHSSLSVRMLWFFLHSCFQVSGILSSLSPRNRLGFQNPLIFLFEGQAPYTTSLRVHSSLSVRVLKLLFLAVMFQISVILSSLILDLLQLRSKKSARVARSACAEHTGTDPPKVSFCKGISRKYHHHNPGKMMMMCFASPSSKSDF